MNIVFFGSSDFSVPCLEGILGSRHRVVCVVTQPDRRKGRGLSMVGTPVKSLAIKEKLKVYQPLNINSIESIEFLKSLKPDLFVVIAYGQIFSGQVLSLPKIFSINLHASILPAYRGAAPVNWAIIKGESVTGVSIIRMSSKMDAGDIILQEKIGISQTDTAVTLEEKLSRLGASLLPDCLDSIENKTYCLKPQGNDNVSFAPKLKKEDGRINWAKPALEIYNLIRGCLNWPGAFTYYRGKLLKIYEANVLTPLDLKSLHKPGEVIDVSLEGISVACGKDNLIIRQLQLEGGRVMTARDFILGHKIGIKEILG